MDACGNPKAVVGFVYSDQYRQLVCSSPKFTDRFALVADLINAYHLVNYMVRIPPLSMDHCVVEKLTAFHSEEYVNALRSVQCWHQSNQDECEPDESAFESFGLSYDCPGFSHVFDYAVACTLGSLAASEALLRNDCQVAINWAGGWHHAKRSEAAGFCYLNDAVLAIHRLMTGSHPSHLGTSGRVLYVDLDLHHGDGVEEAFWYSPRVVTFSVHHASPGFFPGTGQCLLHDGHDSSCLCIPTGAGRGRFSAFNLPLAESTGDEAWSAAVLPILELLHAVVRPSFVVVQCGADGLADDPHRVFNLTNAPSPGVWFEETDEDSNGPIRSDIGSYSAAVRLILSWKIPTLLLGGGGYNFPSTARLWTVLTAQAIASTSGSTIKLTSDIPEHSYLARYGPDFSLHVSSLPKVDRASKQQEAAQDLVTQQNRLFEQACSYAELNHLPYDRNKLKLCLDHSVFNSESKRCD